MNATPLSVTQARQAIRVRLAGEEGTIYKDWGGRIPLALVFPNHYRVAMSNLGFQSLYGSLNAEPDIVCERVTWEGEDFPPLSLESQYPLGEFPLWAISIPFELDYFHLVSLLRKTGVPLYAAERGEDDPILLGGGVALSANPEPVAPFLDAVIVGEAEPILQPLLEILRGARGQPRADTIAALGRLPGAYLPAEKPARPVVRQWARDLSFSTHTVVLTKDTEFGDAYLVEIARGCRFGCRFCLAGHITRPARFRSLEQLLPQFEEGLRYRRRIGLVGAAVSDHPQLDEIVAAIRSLGGGFTVASVRADQLTPALLAGLRASGTQTLTLAPEVATSGMVATVGKGFGEEELLRGVDMAWQAGLRRIKLYFMLGLPCETEQDVQGVVAMVGAVRERMKRGNVSISVAPFVPKAHTPFQWASMAEADVLQERMRLLSRELKPLRVGVEEESVAWSRIQGVLARGDRRLAQVLARMGGLTLAGWRKALVEEGLSEEEYLRERSPDESFPWDFIASGVKRDYLLREWTRARAAQSGQPCPPGQDCRRCGVCIPE